MKKALIIGGAGFVGGYLADHLTNECKWSVCTTRLEHERIAHPSGEVRVLDILDAGAVVALFDDYRPDYVLHLAAQSSVAYSWKNPSLTVDVNIKGAVNVLEALRSRRPEARMLLVGSGEQYGAVAPEDCPIAETTIPQPKNVYALSKLCQEQLGRLYVDAYGCDIMMVRAFNHIGPGQSPQFAAADFAQQIAKIESGEQPPVISVGNLAAQRDFTDVRDVVRAYSALLCYGRSGEIYNVGSGVAVSIEQLLSGLLSLSTASIEVRCDPARLRPIDVPLVRADISKILRDVGWRPQLSLEKTLSDTLEYFRRAQGNVATGD